MTLESTSNIHWYAARTRHGQELKVRDRLVDRHVENFVPSKQVVRQRNGRKYKVDVPLIPNLVFLRTTKDDACSLANGADLPVYYLIDRSTRSLLVIPNKQMDDFIRVVTTEPDSICDEMPDLRLGQDVRIMRGALEGVEGKVLMLTNRTYVVVSIGEMLSAKVSIPRSHVKIISNHGEAEK